MQVVGKAFLPWSPHSAYTDGAWIDAAALRDVRRKVPPDEGFDFLLMEVAPGTDRQKLAATSGEDGLELGPPVPSTDVLALGKLRTLPLVLGGFLALLAVATLAHALVTTVNRRRRELAVLRAARLRATPVPPRDRLAGHTARRDRCGRRGAARNRRSAGPSGVRSPRAFRWCTPPRSR